MYSWNEVDLCPQGIVMAAMMAQYNAGKSVRRLKSHFVGKTFIGTSITHLKRLEPGFM